MKYSRLFLSTLVFLTLACSSDPDNNFGPASPPDVGPETPELYELTIFFINDQHGQLGNFAKIKYIVDQEEKTRDVILACSGDAFSGNPVVDNYADRGYPMIDIMNKAGFDVAVLGNHEFDYGPEVLKKRLAQSEFPWISANLETHDIIVPDPEEFITLTLPSGLKATFLGLVETNGKPGAIIPSTHPWRVKDFTFTTYQQALPAYENLKATEDADLFIALTHLGRGSDFNVAENYPYFDLILGGHSHTIVGEERNGIPVFQSGSYLNYLGKIELTVQNEEITDYTYTLINLNTYPNLDQTLADEIEAYSEKANLDELIGNSLANHSKSNTGCFYTETLRQQLQADITFQNPGGVRNTLGYGDITKADVYAIDPFNNGSLVYEMSVAEVKNFLEVSNSSFYYSGLSLSRNGSVIEITDGAGKVLPDSEILTVGINDYIPAVFDNLFPAKYQTMPYTTSEALITYLQNTSADTDYSDCVKIFQ